MTVEHYMTKNPITCRDDENIYRVKEVMKREAIHRLPVLNRDGKLVGIISEKDIITAAPALSSSPSISDYAYLLSKLEVKDVMSEEVVTIGPNAPIEKAARDMLDQEISCLPVVNGGELVGIITKTDMFSILLELFGARHYGVRATLRIEDKPGTIARITAHLKEYNVDIVSIGTIRRPSGGLCTLRVQGIDTEKLREIIKADVEEVLDIREV